MTDDKTAGGRLESGSRRILILWIGVGLTVVVIIGLPIVFFVLPTHLVPSRAAGNLPRDPQARLTLEDNRLKLQNDVRATGVQALGGFLSGLVLLGGGYVGWRQLQISRGQLLAAREGQITERFTRAVDQLGSESLDVRLGGIYGLERLARGSSEDHPAAIEILTAYIRQRSPWPPTRPGQYVADAQLDELPDLITRAPDVQAAVTVIGRRNIADDDTNAVLNLAGVDLRKANLSGAKLRGVLLERASLEGARLADAVLDAAILNHTDLRSAYLRRTRLAGAWLQSAQLAKAVVFGTTLDGANLTEADLTEAKLYDLRDVRNSLRTATLAAARLTGATLDNVDLDQANLIGADFGGADLAGSSFRKAVLVNANLAGARMSQTVLTGAILGRVKDTAEIVDLLAIVDSDQRNQLSGALALSQLRARRKGGTAELAGAVLTDTDLYGCDLSDCQMVGVNLAGAKLVQAILTGSVLDYANLAGAELTRANLAGASCVHVDLTGAKLRNADLRGACMAEAILERANLNSSSLQNLDLRNARLGAAILGDAHLEDADLKGADLRLADLSHVVWEPITWPSGDEAGEPIVLAMGAHLKGADLGGADLRGADLSAVKGFDLSGCAAAITDSETRLPPTL